MEHPTRTREPAWMGCTLLVLVICGVCERWAAPFLGAQVVLGWVVLFAAYRRAGNALFDNWIVAAAGAAVTSGVCIASAAVVLGRVSILDTGEVVYTVSGGIGCGIFAKWLASDAIAGYRNRPASANTDTLTPVDD